MTTHDIIHTCKQNFLYLYHLSTICNINLIVMIYSAFLLLMFVLLLFLKSDVLMMMCKTRVEPFDVLIINTIADQTSVDRATQLVDECQDKRRKR